MMFSTVCSAMDFPKLNGYSNTKSSWFWQGFKKISSKQIQTSWRSRKRTNSPRWSSPLANLWRTGLTQLGSGFPGKLLAIHNFIK